MTKLNINKGEGDDDKEDTLSADNVEQYLLKLDTINNHPATTTQLADKQWDEAKLSRVMNVKRFQDLLNQSDQFLRYLSDEIDDFEVHTNSKGD